MADSITRSAARAATLVALPVAILVGVLAFGLLGGLPGRTAARSPSDRPRPQSTGPVQMSAAPLTARQASVCRDLLAHLPETVRELRRRPVTAGNEQNAAYGDPALTVACGAPPAPAGVVQDLWGINGVCWSVTRNGEVTVWTTVETEVPVAVTVPRTYDPPGEWVIDFSAPVLAAVPAGPPRCQ